jgi:hypothetical protein
MCRLTEFVPGIMPKSRLSTFLLAPLREWLLFQHQRTVENHHSRSKLRLKFLDLVRLKFGGFDPLDHFW